MPETCLKLESIEATDIAAFRATRSVRVLVISPSVSDHLNAAAYLASLDWRVLQAETYREGISMLRRYPVAAVLCDDSLADGNWRDVLSHIAPFPEPPRLIVMSRVADELLWSEVLTLGGYDILLKPLESRETIRIVSLACGEWQSHQDRQDVSRSQGSLALTAAGR